MDTEQEQKLEETITEIKKDTQNLIDDAQIESMIKDNVLEFEHESVKYRVRKPNFHEKQDLAVKRQQKYINLLKDKTNLLEDDLIKVFEDRGISVKELNDKMKVLDKRKEDLSMKLGKAIADKIAEEEIEPFKNELKDIINEQSEILIRKSVLLEGSIESQVNIFTYTYTTFLVTEKLEEDKWVRAWQTHEDFLQEDEKFVNQVVWYVSLLSKYDLPSM